MEERLTTDEERFMLWLDEDVIGHLAGTCAEPPQHWEDMRREVNQLAELLRIHMLDGVVLPTPAAFNAQIQQRIIVCRNLHRVPATLV